MARASRKRRRRWPSARRARRGRRGGVSTARAPTRRAVDGFLDRLPRLTIVAGKGGVGKTTCAMGIAGHLSRRGKPTLLVSTDPANSLGPMLGVSLRDGEICQIADDF